MTLLGTRGEGEKHSEDFLVKDGEVVAGMLSTERLHGREKSTVSFCLGDRVWWTRMLGRTEGSCGGLPVDSFAQ